MAGGSALRHLWLESTFRTLGIASRIMAPIFAALPTSGGAASTPWGILVICLSLVSQAAQSGSTAEIPAIRPSAPPAKEIQDSAKAAVA